MDKDILLQKHQSGQRDFQGLDLSDFNLRGIDVPESDFCGATFDRSDLSCRPLRKDESRLLAELRESELSDNELQESELSDNEEGVSSSDFIYYDVGESNLENSKFRNASLRETRLCGAKLSHTDFQNADLSNANLSSDFIHVTGDVYDGVLCATQLVNADLTNANLSGASCSNAELTNAKLTNANLSRANCSNANFYGAILNNVILDDADLSNANFGKTDLRGSSFVRANLTDTNFSNANLSGIDLASSYWGVAKLSGAVLIGVNMRRLDLSGGDLSNTDLKDSNLSGAILRRANMQNANLLAADLEEVRLESSILRGTNFRKADLSGANLDGANLESAIMQEAEITDASILDADMLRANLIDSNLSMTTLDGSNLQGANLTGAILRGAHLCGVNLRGANLSKVDLCGADLTGANLSQAEVTDAKINIKTYVESSWSPGIIAELYQRGANIVDLDHFPMEVQSMIRSNEQGLTLYFNTRLSSFDRFLVDGVIFAILGRHSDCQVFDYKEKGDTAIVRLRSGSQKDLESVAEALYQRVWEAQEKAQNTAIVRYSGLLFNNEIRRDMSNLRDRIDHISMRGESEEAVSSSLQQVSHPLKASLKWDWNLKQDYLKLQQPINICTIYAPEDRKLYGRFEKHIAELRRQGFITTWSEAEIMPGQDRTHETIRAVVSADIIVLLISPDFLGSEGSIQELIKLSLNRNNLDNACIVPVLVRPVAWEISGLNHFQVLPDNENPIELWQNQDEGWVNVIMGIRRLVLDFRGKP